MDFILNGQNVSLTAHDVELRLTGVRPEAVQTHGVEVAGTVYPVKQAFAVATGVPRPGFTSQTARRLLARLGFTIIGEPSSASVVSRSKGPDRCVRAAEPVGPVHPRAWPWEGEVQRVFTEWLTAHR